MSESLYLLMRKRILAQLAISPRSTAALAELCNADDPQSSAAYLRARQALENSLDIEQAWPGLWALCPED